MDHSKKLFIRRQARNRTKLKAGGNLRPRLSVYRSGKHIYAQIIDDAKGATLATVSTLDKAFRESVKSGANIEAAGAVGKEIAVRAKKAGVETVVFDRGGYRYHGRVKALAEAAREAGLVF